MTDQPPEETERIYSGQYGDYTTGQGQYGQGQYGQDRYTEHPYGDSQPGTGPQQGVGQPGGDQYSGADQFLGSDQFGGASQYSSPGQYAESQYAESQYTQAQYGDTRYREAPAAYPANPAADTSVYNFTGDQTAFGGYGTSPSAGAQGGAQGGRDAAGSGAAGLGAAGLGAVRGARQRVGGGAAKGFLNALFDFEFSSYVTPKIAKPIYMLAVAAFAIGAVVFALFAFTLSTYFGVVTLFILAPLTFLVGVAFWRVILEFAMATFQMAADIRKLREGGEKESSQL